MKSKEALDPMAAGQLRRAELIQTLLRACQTALDLGMAALQRGNPNLAHHEIQEVTRVCQTMLRFLPDVADAKRRASLTSEIRDVQEKLRTLSERWGSTKKAPHAYGEKGPTQLQDHRIVGNSIVPSRLVEK